MAAGRLIPIEYYSRYVGCVNGITIFSRSVLQQSLTLKLMPLGLYITGWGSINVERDSGMKWGNETDLIAGIKRRIWKFDVDTGYAYFNLFPSSGHVATSTHSSLKSLCRMILSRHI